ncbi:MOSC domain-containing protein [Pseudonocardia nigra]|uniref:MOSC domain-containing protein n=1 Tax=Pseudonocardia nigra TaxID=1921578 RepID=UPI0027E35D92|nr:MOSC N-terminal beta barrel domain-containing protein [Pseudonocardia nigra]
MAKVVELTSYPVKGCAGTPLRTTDLTPAGLAHDRTFMVVGPDGVFRTQRRSPLLAVVRPEVSDDGRLLTLRAPGSDPLCLDVDTDGPRREVTLFANRFGGIDQGDEGAAWFSDVLGVPSRLVRVPPEHDRRTDGLTPGTSAYADSSALLLVGRASLDLLNERIAEAGGEPVAMNRFRPNIVVDGWDEPHTEDRLRTFAVGTAELGYAKLAIRCAVTTVEQETGRRAGPEPLRTLARHRRAAAGGVAFGAKFSVTRPGSLAIGAEVRVDQWGESE